MRTTGNGTPSSSLPSVRKSHATVTDVPDATTPSYGLYGEPRYPNSRSSEKPLLTKASTSSALKLDAAEVCISICLSFPILGPPFDYIRFENIVSGIVVSKRIAPYPFVLAYHHTDICTPFLCRTHTSLLTVSQGWETPCPQIR